MKLTPYQLRIVEAVRQQLRARTAALVVVPTGAGQPALASAFIAADQRRRGVCS